MEKLSICYATDDNYIEYTAVSLYSLLENNYDLDIDFYILEYNVSERNKKLINEIIWNRKQQVYWVDVSNELKNIEALGGRAYRGYSTYARIYIDRLLPQEVKKVLYIDGDTLIVSSIKKIIDFDLGEKILAGVKDTVVPEYKEAIHFAVYDSYINAGVLYIDRDKWHEKDCEKLLQERLDEICSNSLMPDQDLINIVLKDEICYLPIEFNLYDTIYAFDYKYLKKIYRFSNDFYSEEEVDCGKNDAVIVHFTCGFLGRPWTDYCINPYKELWEKNYCDLFNKTIKKEKFKQKTKNKIITWFYLHFNSILFSWIYRLIRSITGKKVIRKYDGMWRNE